MARVETGMFVGTVPPWVGLGNSVAEAQTSEQALGLSGLDWSVEPQPLFLEDGSEVENQKANVRSSDNRVLGIVTDRYKVVQNREAFAFTDALLGEGVRYETAGALSNGSRVWMLAKMSTATICGDNIDPYLVFTNSHDGSGSVRVALTPIRVVCQNTLTMALKSATRTWSVRHLGDISNKMADAQETLLNVKTYMQELEKKSEEATQVTVVAPAFLRYVEEMFKIPANATMRQVGNIQMQKEAFKDLYNNKDDLKKFRGTAYGVVQAVADFVPHFKPMRETPTTAENRFMNIADGNKNGLMERTCAYFGLF